MSEKLVVKFSETLDGLESEDKFSSLVKLGMRLNVSMLIITRA